MLKYPALQLQNQKVETVWCGPTKIFSLFSVMCLHSLHNNFFMRIVLRQPFVPTNSKDEINEISDTFFLEHAARYPKISTRLRTAPTDSPSNASPTASHGSPDSNVKHVTFIRIRTTVSTQYVTRRPSGHQLTRLVCFARGTADDDGFSERLWQHEKSRTPIIQQRTYLNRNNADRTVLFITRRNNV